MRNCCKFFSLLYVKKMQFSLFPAFLWPRQAGEQNSHHGRLQAEVTAWKLRAGAHPRYKIWGGGGGGKEDEQGNRRVFPITSVMEVEDHSHGTPKEEFWGGKICFCCIWFCKNLFFSFQGILQVKGLNRPWHFPAGERSFAATNKKDSTRANKEKWISLMA